MPGTTPRWRIRRFAGGGPAECPRRGLCRGGAVPAGRLWPRAAPALGAPLALLCAQALGEGHDYFPMGSPDVSTDETLADFGTDAKGSEFYDLRIRDLATGKDKRDKLKNTSGDVAWAADGKSFFYTVQDEHHRPLKTYLHSLGTKQADDKLVHNEKDTGRFTSVETTSSERFAAISIHDHETSQVLLIALAKPKLKPRMVVPCTAQIEYDVQDWQETLTIPTNAGGAEDYKPVQAPLANPA